MRIAHLKTDIFRLIPLVFLASLAACSLGGGSDTVTCEYQFWNGTFATCLPKDWKVLSQETLMTMGVPEETVSAFQSATPRGGQLDTITVTKEPLSDGADTPAYSQSNVAAVSALPDYKLIDKSVIYIDGHESALHVFSARTAADGPARRYYQVSGVKDKNGYVFTGSFPLSIEDPAADEVELILKNISFVDPKAVTQE